MGAKPSKTIATVDNTTEQVIVSENTMNLLNEQVNNINAQTTITNNQNALQETRGDNTIDFRGCHIKGSVNIDRVTQKSVILVDFKSVQVSTVENKIAQNMLDKIMTGIENSVNAETLAVMKAAAESSSKNGFIPPAGDTKSNAKNKFNMKINNNTDTNISNVIKQSINVGFNVEDIKKCVDSINDKQSLDFSNCEVDGNVTIENFTQDASIENIGSCLQNSSVTNKVINMAASELGVSVLSNTEYASKIEQTGKAKAKEITTDPVEDLFNGLSNVIGSIGGAFGMGDNATMAVSSSSSSSLCVLLLVLMLGLGYIAMNSDNDKNSMSGGGISQQQMLIMGFVILCTIR